MGPDRPPAAQPLPPFHMPPCPFQSPHRTFHTLIASSLQSLKACKSISCRLEASLPRSRIASSLRRPLRHSPLARARRPSRAPRGADQTPPEAFAAGSRDEGLRANGEEWRRPASRLMDGGRPESKNCLRQRKASNYSRPDEASAHGAAREQCERGCKRRRKKRYTTSP